MYTATFIVIFFGTLFFWVASRNVKIADKPKWLWGMAQKPTYARLVGTAVLLSCWAAVVRWQGLGAGTLAMGGYLMASYSLWLVLRPLHCFNPTGLVTVALVALLLETIIF